MSSSELKKVLEFFNKRTAAARKTVDDDRLSYELMTSHCSMDPGTEIERIGIDGVPGEWIYTPGSVRENIIMYLHGGGYILGSMRTHRAMLSWISKASGARVLGIEYRLAPENKFPAPLEDSLKTYRWLLANGADPRRIIFAGDSAGGGLAISTMVMLKYLGLPLPAASVGISPWTDLSASGQTYSTNALVDPSVSRDRILYLASLYMGDRDLQAPLASPLFADLSGLPRILLQVGSVEVLLDDSLVLAERAKKVGVDAKVEIYDNMPHVWTLFAPMLTEGRQAIESIGRFVKEAIN